MLRLGNLCAVTFALAVSINLHFIYGFFNIRKRFSNSSGVSSGAYSSTRIIEVPTKRVLDGCLLIACVLVLHNSPTAHDWAKTINRINKYKKKEQKKNKYLNEFHLNWGYIDLHSKRERERERARERSMRIKSSACQLFWHSPPPCLSICGRAP